MKTSNQFALMGSLGLSLVLAACGSAGSTTPADELAGMWLMESFTGNDMGTPVTLTRDGTPDSVRGDLLATATGDNTVSWTVRLNALRDGLLVNTPPIDTQTVVLEDGKMVVTDSQSYVSVFDYTITGDTLQVDFDAADPRTTATNPPSAATLTRVDPWGTQSVGAWDILSLTSAGGTVTPDTCQQVQPALWATNVMTVDISERHMFQRTATIQSYLDDACTQADQQYVDVQLGMAEESGTRLRLWTFSPQAPDRSEYYEFTMAPSGNELTLTRDTCLPTPTCTDSGPIEVVIRRQ